jgi:hypothetical protein
MPLEGADGEDAPLLVYSGRQRLDAQVNGKCATYSRRSFGLLRHNEA